MLDQVLSELLGEGDGKVALAIALALIKKAKRGDLRACQLIAERTQGKPAQAMQVTGIDRASEIQNMTDEELNQRIRELEEKWGNGK